MHNGLLRGFREIKRDLVQAVEPGLFPFIEGTTDSEVFFYLALTFGLQDDPVTAVQHAVGFIEDVGHRHGIADPVQMTVMTGDGESMWAFRYSSEHRSRSLYLSTEMETLRQLYPNNPQFWEVSVESRLVVSEPFGQIVGAWNEVGESQWVAIRPGPDETGDFVPRLP